jgi:Flp pilus assembly protein TadD
MLRVGISIGVGLGLLMACASPPPRAPGDIAAAYLSAGRLPEATREIERAILVRPRDVSLRRQAARIYVEASRADRAVEHLEAAIQLTPQDGGLWIDLGEIERDRENIADAYVAFRRASALAPTDVRAVSGLAVSAENLGFSEEASEAYARWAELKLSLGADAAE